MSETSDTKLEKEVAGRAGAAFVHDGDVVGLGTGSTAAYFLQALGEQVSNGLKVRGIPTSTATRDLAVSLSIPLTNFDEVQQIDVTVDGADEFDADLNMIKGGGGALLREKIVASASRKVVIVADSQKQVEKLGKFPLPVEVIPFAQALLAKRISDLGALVEVRLRKDGNAFVTDEGHHILDCAFGQINDPAGLARRLSDMPGVVEHGLFIGMADIVLVADGDKVKELRKT